MLSELVKHHIEEEEGEILPKAEESDLDWDELETQVMKKKEQLMTKGKLSRSAGNGRSSRQKGSARKKSH